MSKRAAEFLGLDLSDSKIIVAHLGNGASISAVLTPRTPDFLFSTFMTPAISNPSFFAIYLGITVDEEANKKRGEDLVISAADSKVKVAVIPTNEELAIALSLQS